MTNCSYYTLVNTLIFQKVRYTTQLPKCSVTNYSILHAAGQHVTLRNGNMLSWTIRASVFSVLQVVLYIMC